MQTTFLSIPVRIIRGLLAVVFVVSNWFHGGCCCWAAASCGITQDEDRCCSTDAIEGCCCCHQSSDGELANSTCCCSETSQQSSTGCPGACHCSASPLTEGIIAAPHRIQQKKDQQTWLTDFNSNPLQRISNSIVSTDLRLGPQYPGEPCAHNLRQSILCVWRN